MASHVIGLREPRQYSRTRSRRAVGGSGPWRPGQIACRIRLGFVFGDEIDLPAPGSAELDARLVAVRRPAIADDERGSCVARIEGEGGPPTPPAR